jgi:hypothetical protein
VRSPAGHSRPDHAAGVPATAYAVQRQGADLRTPARSPRRGRTTSRSVLGPKGCRTAAGTTCPTSRCWWRPLCRGTGEQPGGRGGAASTPPASDRRRAQLVASATPARPGLRRRSVQPGTVPCTINWRAPVDPAVLDRSRRSEAQEPLRPLGVQLRRVGAGPHTRADLRTPERCPAGRDDTSVRPRVRGAGPSGRDRTLDRRLDPCGGRLGGEHRKPPGSQGKQPRRVGDAPGHGGSSLHPALPGSARPNAPVPPAGAVAAGHRPATDDKVSTPRRARGAERVRSLRAAGSGLGESPTNRPRAELVPPNGSRSRGLRRRLRLAGRGRSCWTVRLVTVPTDVVPWRGRGGGRRESRRAQGASAPRAGEVPGPCGARCVWRFRWARSEAPVRPSGGGRSCWTVLAGYPSRHRRRPPGAVGVAGDRRAWGAGRRGHEPARCRDRAELAASGVPARQA